MRIPYGYAFLTFFPDDEIFETIDFQYDSVRTRLREVAYLNKGLVIELTDNRKGREARDVFRFDGGIKDFVEYLNRRAKRESRAAITVTLLLTTKNASFTAVLSNCLRARPDILNAVRLRTWAR